MARHQHGTGKREQRKHPPRPTCNSRTNLRSPAVANIAGRPGRHEHGTRYGKENADTAGEALPLRAGSRKGKGLAARAARALAPPAPKRLAGWVLRKVEDAAKGRRQ